MAGRRITIIQGHPDPAGGHFVHALADAYERGARETGHEVKRIDVARLAFPLLHNAQQWQWQPPAESIGAAQQAIAWAEHLVILYPLWLGDLPALLKGFFEQTLRPGFAIGKAAPGRLPKKLLAGRSARVVVTMGMPALFYKLYYRAHTLKSLKRNILEFCGISPVRTTVIGMVEGSKDARAGWLTRLAVLGVQGA
ncbi:MAG TPA: NAD(P)H-dependent oxidoreductase [Burkholderiales bacterium]|nr:NAD(P)H-dependent oxidoreductase [Burkholderiales bacterium]